MQMTQKKIGAGQFFSILLLCRLLVNLTFNSNDSSLSSCDKIISDILTVAFIFVMSIPVFIYMKKGWDFSDCIRSISPKLNKAVCFFYSLYFIILASITVTRFQLFTTSTLVSEGNVTNVLYIALLVLSALYGAYLGFQAIGRAAFIFAIVVISAIFFLFLTSAKNFDFVNITPFFYNGTKNILQNAVKNAASTTEIAMLTMFHSRVSGNKVKGQAITILIFLILELLLSVPSCLVLGDLAPKLFFPEYVLATMASLDMLKSLDAFINACWVLAATIKTAFMIILSHFCIGNVFKIKKNLPWLVGIALVVFSISLVFSKYISTFILIIGSFNFIIASFVFSVAIPLIVLIVHALKERKNKKEGLL
ncbi:MAG: spore germination protein [Clostridiales bacterium]|nr:spore germination protein [Clostridiales bacterium]